MTTPGHDITGGATPEVAAAIAAVVAYLIDAEATARATPAKRPRQSSWVLAGRPRETAAPLPSHTFDALGWAEAAEPEDT